MHTPTGNPCGIALRTDGIARVAYTILPQAKRSSTCMKVRRSARLAANGRSQQGDTLWHEESCSQRLQQI
jgi:hypothetical protein